MFQLCSFGQKRECRSAGFRVVEVCQLVSKNMVSAIRVHTQNRSDALSVFFPCRRDQALYQRSSGGATAAAAAGNGGGAAPATGSSGAAAGGGGSTAVLATSSALPGAVGEERPSCHLLVSGFAKCVECTNVNNSLRRAAERERAAEADPALRRPTAHAAEPPLARRAHSRDQHPEAGGRGAAEAAQAAGQARSAGSAGLKNAAGQAAARRTAATTQAAPAHPAPALLAPGQMAAVPRPAAQAAPVQAAASQPAPAQRSPLHTAPTQVPAMPAALQVSGAQTAAALPPPAHASAVRAAAAQTTASQKAPGQMAAVPRPAVQAVLPRPASGGVSLKGTWLSGALRLDVRHMLLVHDLNVLSCFNEFLAGLLHFALPNCTHLIIANRN